MLKALLALPPMVLVFAGCSSQIDGAPETPRPIAATSGQAPTMPITTASSSAAASGTITAQVASIVAAHAPAIDKAASSIAPCGSIYDPADTVCTLGRVRYATAVAALGVTFTGAISPTSHTYLGQPPAALAPLISATSAAINLMANAESALETACTAATSESCTDAAAGWVKTEENVTSALADWSQYTH